MGNNVKRSIRTRRKSSGFGNEAARGPSKEGTRIEHFERLTGPLKFGDLEPLL